MCVRAIQSIGFISRRRCRVHKGPGSTLRVLTDAAALRFSVRQDGLCLAGGFIPPAGG